MRSSIEGLAMEDRRRSRAWRNNFIPQCLPPLRAKGSATAFRFARRNGVQSTHRFSHCVRRPTKKKTRKPAKPAGNFSGVDENRTHNLLNAIQALCQLSYHPCNQTTAKSITSRVENAPRIEVTFFRAIRHSQSRERRARAKSRHASDASVRPISP